MAVEARSITFVSDTSGDATGKINACYGKLVGVETVNVVQPTDQWDIAITSDQGTALFTDTGVGNAANEFIIPTLAGTAGGAAPTEHCYPVAGALNFVLANLGSAKTVKVLVYIEC